VVSEIANLRRLSKRLDKGGCPVHLTKKWSLNELLRCSGIKSGQNNDVKYGLILRLNGWKPE
jgi:hypothetical protein